MKFYKGQDLYYKYLIVFVHFNVLIFLGGWISCQNYDNLFHSLSLCEKFCMSLYLFMCASFSLMDNTCFFFSYTPERTGEINCDSWYLFGSKHYHRKWYSWQHLRSSETIPRPLPDNLNPFISDILWVVACRVSGFSEVCQGSLRCVSCWFVFLFTFLKVWS